MSETKLDTPEERIAFLRKAGIESGFYIISDKDLSRISSGTSLLNVEIKQWRSLSMGVFGVNTPESALTQAQMQKKHRQGIMDDRMRFREALMKILTLSLESEDWPAEAKAIARKAINHA